MEMKKEITLDEMYEILVDEWDLEDFVSGAICIGGYNEDTLEAVLFYHTGYRSFEQYYEFE